MSNGSSRTIKTSVFDSLPCVTFVNESWGERHVWVCTSIEEAHARIDELHKQEHISQIEFVNACVKGA